MLAMVKEGKMDRLRHKLWQAKINVWIRAPGLISCVTVVVLGEMHDENHGESAAANKYGV